MGGIIRGDVVESTDVMVPTTEPETSATQDDKKDEQAEDEGKKD